MLNLKGADGAALAERDSVALQPVLGAAEQSSATAPKCDVLFLYADLSPEGRISSNGASLRDIVRASEALIVVVASENSAEAYTASGKSGPYGRVNLAMTLARKGEAFPLFFRRLFEDMNRGVSMPVAWVKLAPQVPGMEHPDCPEAFFTCGAGQVRFRR